MRDEERPSEAAAAPDNPGGFRHVPALDGIRGLALLLVLIDHLFWANDKTGSRITDFLAAVRDSTYCGVDLFFALSGFLITGILLDTLQVRPYFETFYARRSLRIFPLYYASLLLILLLSHPFHLAWHGWEYYFFTYTANLVLWHRPALDLGYFNINHFWSLQVEEQFYLVWPLVIYRVRRPETLVRISLVAAGVIFLVRVFLMAMHGHPGFESRYLVYTPTFACADNILFGCGLCAALRTRWREPVLRAAGQVFPVCLAILLGAGIWHGTLDWTGSYFIPTVGFSVFGIASAALIAMTLDAGSRTQRFFEDRRLRFFGKYSYGIYVYHFTLLELSIALRPWVLRHVHSKALTVVLLGFATFGVSIGVAVLSYHLFEVRFLQLKRYFSYAGGAARKTVLAKS